MKTVLATMVPAILLSCVAAGSAWAQEEEAEGPGAVPVETYACTYNEGQGPEDLDKVIAEWNQWMDDQGRHDYFAATVVPHYWGSWKMDVGWLGAWTDGNAMGAGTDFYLSEGGELANEFSEVLTCSSHSGFISINIKELVANDQADDNFVLNFSNCSFKGERNFEDLLAAQIAWNAYADEHGFVGAAWVLFPLFGESDNDYDFKYVYSEPDHTSAGANWQLYADGHWQKSDELYRDVMECDVTRVYNATTVRRIAPDEGG